MKEKHARLMDLILTFISESEDPSALHNYLQDHEVRYPEKDLAELHEAVWQIQAAA